MKNRTRILFLISAFALAGCSMFSPSSESSKTSTKSDVSSSASSSESVSSQSQTTIPTSVSTSESQASSEVQTPKIALSLQDSGDVLIAESEYSNIDYNVKVPYEGNKYAFPKPQLLNYDGEYEFVYSDKDTILFFEEEGRLFIQCKYDFGAYFHMAAKDKQGNEIASIYIQLETTQIGRGQLHIFYYNEDTEIFDGDLIQLAPKETLKLQPKYNTTRHTDILTSSNTDIVSITNNQYAVTLKAGDTLGESVITATYSEADSTGQSYDYSLSFTVQVTKDTSLTEIYLEQEEVYIVNGEGKYNGSFLAKLASGEEVEIPEKDLTIEVLEGNNVLFSYTLNGVTKQVTYPGKVISASAYQTTAMGHSFHDYWANYSTGMTSLPLSGNVNLLVIPVWFTDSESYFDASQKDAIREDINTICFGEEKLGAGTLKTFYETESLGKVTITGKVAPWFIDEHPSTFYNDQITSDVHYLFERALDNYWNNNTEDAISNYDRSGDGKIDGAIFFYAANHYGSLNSCDSNAFASRFNNIGVGAHKYLNHACFCPVGPMYGFNGEATTAQKTTEDLSKLNPSAFENAANIVTHEVGHMFGAVDLYTRAGNSHIHASEQAHQYAGQFSMQDNNSGSHDPIQNVLYNWAEPMVFSASNYEVGTELNVYLDDFQENHASILLSPEWNAINSPFDEYMLLELYSPSGLNEYHASKTSSNFNAKGAGVRLWHADAALMKSNNNQRSYDPIQSGISFIADNHDVWEMNNFHFAHMIRNNESEDYEPTRGMQPSDLFAADDAFSMERFGKQFVEGDGILDSGKKLGWEFEVTSLFHNGKGGYSASIKLTRVSDEITEFKSSIEFPDGSLPEGSDIDATSYFGLNQEHLTMTLHQNDSVTALSCGWEYPDHYLLLGKGASFDLAMRDIEGYEVSIKRIFILYKMGTNVTPRGKPTVYQGNTPVEGIEHKDYKDLEPSDPFYMSYTYEYVIDGKSVSVFNEDDANLYVNMVRIEYHIAKVF